MVKLSVRLVAALVAVAASVPGHAEFIDGIYDPMLARGPSFGTGVDPSIDPNVPSAFSGVVAINVVYGNTSILCSGTLIDPTHVLTAAHCVDTTATITGATANTNKVVDLSAAGSAVKVKFNLSGDGAVNPANTITARRIVVHPDFAGFGRCPATLPAGSVCRGDDLAVIELSAPAPADAAIYAIHRDPIAIGASLTMVGYGYGGNGVDGFALPDPTLPDGSPLKYGVAKRIGTNNYDLYDPNDEDPTASTREVWYADFDGGGQDPYCLLLTPVTRRICTVGNPLTESTIAPGDSGGGAFMMYNGKYELVGTLDFGSSSGKYGSTLGGMLISSYADWLTYDIPEPGMLGLFGLGALGLAVRRRKA